MKNNCKVCKRKDVKTVNKEIRAGVRPGKLLQKYDIGISSVGYHRRKCLGMLIGGTGIHKMGKEPNVNMFHNPKINMGYESIEIRFARTANVMERVKKLSGNGRGKGTKAIMAYLMLEALAKAERRNLPIEQHPEDCLYVDDKPFDEMVACDDAEVIE